LTYAGGVGSPPEVFTQKREIHMIWEFDGTGAWEASSKKKNGTYTWRICVCDDGTFSVADSPKILTSRKKTFDTFHDAKTYCEVIEENQMVCDDVV
jgi:hypothetical protein